MKVLKFGGTSVGTAKNILNVKQIVESNNEPVIVVVSALGGITDKLIATSRAAMNGDIAYKKGMNEIISRHQNMITEVIPVGSERIDLMNQVNKLLDELYTLYNNLYETCTLSTVTENAIVSYGERLSSLIVSRLIKGAAWFDSLSFIKTQTRHKRHELDGELTNQLIHTVFATLPKVALVPGFISTDTKSGEITNLGRGGSDYTAAILAAALNADCLEIWTDVNGFMTADPRVIPSAIPIQELSYNEAEELSKFGAKVIYPPTIYPVWHKRIPILIKNTMNPSAAGTIIKQSIYQQTNIIKGISFIKETCLLSLESSYEKDVDTYLLKALTDSGITPLLFNKLTDKNLLAIGVRREDEALACDILKQSLFTSSLTLKEVTHNLAVIAIVGEDVQPDFYSHLYHELSDESIEVFSSNHVDSATTHSFMVHQEKLLQAFELVHSSIFQQVVATAV